ncbi:hypothetical protein GCM10027052_05770 [Parafrigoribacterium mesophilum]
MPMPYLAIAALSGVVVLSYVFSIISGKTRIPTVLMLLVLGIGLREASTALDAQVDVPLEFLQFVGVLGLIIILLEAGLDLSMSKDKLPLIKRATASSLFVLALTTAGIAIIIYMAFGQEWLSSIVYAVPLAVISSTIVASSIGYLTKNKREFLTYESALSDVFGILLFNFLIAGQRLDAGVVALEVLGLVAAVLASIGISIGLVFLLAKVDVNVKAFLIISVLLLIYAVGHAWQLPTLLTVLIFGIVINNWSHSSFRPFHRHLTTGDVESAAETVTSVTVESAFLVRTVFFVLFGYSIDIRSLWDANVLLIGSAIVACILVMRYLYLMVFGRGHILPELFFTPRGLVTIVLFYSIPASLQLTGFSPGILLFVVLATTVIMMIGSVCFTPKAARRDAATVTSSSPVPARS